MVDQYCGGRPSPARRIHLSPPDVGPTEEALVVAAMRSGWVAPAGPDLDAFEREVADRVGCGYAVGVSSGTAALHLALVAVGARPGTVVVVPTLTFVATANAVTYTGAEPVFVDCDPATGNVDVDLLPDLLDDLRRRGRRVAAVMAVDINGVCADYARLLPVCAAAGVPVVEDSAQALGSTYEGRHAGSFGRVGIFSFNGNKIMTTSSGGMLVSEDSVLISRVRRLSTQAREPVAHYEHRDIGYNYRLSNVLAALGRAQLRRLDGMIERRRALRERYAKLFASVPGTRILGDGDAGSNCWLTSLVVEPATAGWRAADLGEHLAAHDIETRPMFKPMHRQPAHLGRRAVVTGAADRLFASGISLPSGSTLLGADADRVFQVVEEFLVRHR
ncbi:DegT/DnrJ/EryC1/StrS aminotransferase family protein [Micromonospora sp. ATCC 39149]|uniref:Aminotransferase class I/II-fold pyridoxal phosphate-dependent enzyme n=1 Tax=Micromonospora carbonacea TaxID=47853 RepID=A0A7D6CEE0_9ACTN|nr:aminotransferase class I/II-fold pyridoxal phosphate-dependent enzyme [Micromonospora sp. ATCC 39149]QLK00231.1 aminotransferase class I/II-fold pyridoxal phosphate-dependent enzyme [Micromonospora carbonacea]